MALTATLAHTDSTLRDLNDLCAIHLTRSRETIHRARQLYKATLHRLLAAEPSSRGQTRPRPLGRSLRLVAGREDERTDLATPPGVFLRLL